MPYNLHELEKRYYLARQKPYRLDHSEILAIVPLHLRVKLQNILTHYEKQLREQEVELKEATSLNQLLMHELKKLKKSSTGKNSNVFLMQEAAQSAINALDAQMKAVDDIFNNPDGLSASEVRSVRRNAFEKLGAEPPDLSIDRDTIVSAPAGEDLENAGAVLEGAEEGGIFGNLFGGNDNSSKPPATETDRKSAHSVQRNNSLGMVDIFGGENNKIHNIFKELDNKKEPKSIYF